MKNTKDLSNIITTLSTFEEGNLPKEALETAAQHWPQIWPVIKQAMIKFNEQPETLSESESNFLFMGIFLAVQQKEPQAYPLLVALCDRSDEYESALEELLGDSICELLPSFFYILSANDTQRLEQLILSPQAGCMVKTAAAHSFIAKYESGLISREQLIELVELWLAYFIPLANDTSEHFLAALAFHCMASDLQEFQAQLLDLANKFELAPDFISPEEIEDWDTTHNGCIASGFIRTEFNVIKELSNWAAYKTPEQNAADYEAMKIALAELQGINPEDLNDEYFDELLNEQLIDDESDEEFLEAFLNDEYGEDDDFYEPIAEPHIAAPKVGRNDPCACGSGKKYKKCCLH